MYKVTPDYGNNGSPDTFDNAFLLPCGIIVVSWELIWITIVCENKHWFYLFILAGLAPSYHQLSYSIKQVLAEGKKWEGASGVKART